MMMSWCMGRLFIDKKNPYFYLSTVALLQMGEWRSGTMVDMWARVFWFVKY